MVLFQKQIFVNKILPEYLNFGLWGRFGQRADKPCNWIEKLVRWFFQYATSSNFDKLRLRGHPQTTLTGLSTPVPSSLTSLLYADGWKILHSLLVKHYNDLLDRQSSEWSRDEVIYFYVRDFFVYTLRLSMPIFKKKSSQRFLGEHTAFLD